MNEVSPSDGRSGFDAVVITHESRTEVLEGIAKSYLLELLHQLEQAKIAQITGTLQPDVTPTMLGARVCYLQSKVDSLTCKLEGVNAL
jgi:hypothetical protein